MLSSPCTIKSELKKAVLQTSLTTTTNIDAIQNYCFLLSLYYLFSGDIDGGKCVPDNDCFKGEGRKKYEDVPPGGEIHHQDVMGARCEQCTWISTGELVTKTERKSCLLINIIGDIHGTKWAFMTQSKNMLAQSTSS